VQKKYSERKIANFIELNSIINSLDLDDGIRVQGCIRDRPGGGFIFISTVNSATNLTQKYCVNTSDRIFNKKANMYLPGGKEEFLYYSEVEEVIKYIKKNAAKPLKAWYY